MEVKLQVDNREKVIFNTNVADLEEDEKRETISKSASEPLKAKGGDGDVKYTMIFALNPRLPKPEAPPGVVETAIRRSFSKPESTPSAVRVPAIRKFIREKSDSFSTAISKRLSSLTDYDVVLEKEKIIHVTEFNLLGLKVVVQENRNEEYKGRISFFSKSNCRDSWAVRSFLRERNLGFVEINIDVFLSREKELIQRTGGSCVPQIFFNEKLLGGLEALYSLRKSGMLEEKMKEWLCRKCPDDAPAPPVYGVDEPGDEKADEMAAVVGILREKLAVQDRLVKMKIVNKCLCAAEMVEVLIKQFDSNRKKAVEIGKQLARSHFIHGVFGNNEFEDGYHFYRFLEHQPFIPRCFNFRGSTNDLQPKPAAAISLQLHKIMSAILESYASSDHTRLDYMAISNSEEFRRYVKLTQDLQRVDMGTLPVDERLAFFLNLYNAMVIHAVIGVGHPGATVIDRRSFNSVFLYVIGGFPFSLTLIKNGVLRNNRRAPFSLAKPFTAAGDRRLQLAIPKVNPLIHFGLCNATRSSPPVRFFTPQGVEAQLRFAAREFLQKTGIEVDLAKRTVYLTRIFKWFSADFGQEKDFLKWIINYLEPRKAGLLTHLLGDGDPVRVVYQDYDWSINC